MTSERDVDHLLVECVLNGDKRAFELLVVKYQRKLLRLVLYFVRDPVEAEDIVQETYIKAYRALPNFRGDSAFYTWLYRIGVNTAKNHLMAQRRRVPTVTDSNSHDSGFQDEVNSYAESDNPESVLASKQLAQTVSDALEELPEELRMAISLREAEGLSYEEIAVLMSCPIGTVRSRIFRARESIANKVRPMLGPAFEKN